MVQKSAQEKTWQITVERNSGSKDEYLIRAGTLHDAFIHFSDFFFPWNMVEIRISEVST